jgi:hypothetical protein
MMTTRQVVVKLEPKVEVDSLSEAEVADLCPWLCKVCVFPALLWRGSGNTRKVHAVCDRLISSSGVLASLQGARGKEEGQLSSREQKKEQPTPGPRDSAVFYTAN